MKKLLVFALPLLVPVLANAQSGRLINRIDRQTGTSITLINADGSFDSRTKPLLRMEPQKAKSFRVVLQDSSITGIYGESPEISATIISSSLSVVKMIFERTHLRIDTNMSAGICLCSCYADFLDTLPASGACDLGGITQPWTFLFHPHCVNKISQTDSIVDYVKLTALTGDPGDTVSFIVKGVFKPASGVADNQPKPVSSNPKITAIYPTPLIQGNSIKVKVLSPLESSLSYSIFDAVGRVIALGVTRQHIALGDNTVTIGSLDGLLNGSYLLKLSFADGSSATHFFQVMR